MAPTELAHLSITEASSGLRRKDFSPSELTRACLERIESIDHKSHSFITVTADLALEQARNAFLSAADYITALELGPY
jgi:aspartyl-tRNA(Asn)/glutamyl-tRNA(Gln) amidotransferase subunit A